MTQDEIEEKKMLMTLFMSAILASPQRGNIREFVNIAEDCANVFLERFKQMDREK
jgi:hypothetical protein